MERANTSTMIGWNDSAVSIQRPSAAEHLLRIVDAGLFSVICIAPFIFGGRHDLGRLVLVLLVAVTALAWFARQAAIPAARWPRTIANAILLLAAALLLAQIVPLPPEWIARLSPTMVDLLPLWTVDGSNAADLGAWRTLSLNPHETKKSLAMLVSYSLLFIVVAGRIQCRDDVERLLKWVAFAAVLMAAFGILHYFTSDGRFFWLYAHPHRLATRNISGAFINRNHFASFLVLGAGPLVAWLLAFVDRPASPATNPSTRSTKTPIADRVLAWAIAAALALVTFAALVSRSRGGAIVLLVAGAVLAAIYLYRGLVDRRFIYGLVGLGVAVVGLLSLHGYEDVVRRLDDFTEGSIDDIDHRGIRRKVWAANVAAFDALWLAGAGAGTHRDILPVFLPESFTKEYTHAENGYLQIATETGIIGLVLLSAGIGVCGAWCVACLRHAKHQADIRLFGAAAAGLAASAVHSAVDFVWYIPACMSVTIVLAGCVLRLSQLARSTSESPAARVLPRGRWLELAAAAVVAAWAVYVYFGPGIAAVYWDRYLRASVAQSKLTQRQMTELVASRPASLPANREPLNDTMLRQLEEVVRWDPHFARAHLRLAAKYIAKFEFAQQNAENAMGLEQIRDAAAASSFTSPGELHAWLQRALGPNVRCLRLAAAEARLAVKLCPLQGQGYMYLADLCFLNGGGPSVGEAYIEQALRVRPYDADVLFEVGKQKLLVGDLPAAMASWQRCFGDTGPHQLSIVYLLAGRIPVDIFLSTYQPDWRTLRDVWARYRELGRPQDAVPLLSYSADAAKRETQQARGARPASIWFWQSGFYRDAGMHVEALSCLERAYACYPGHYPIRRALADALQAAGRYAEAEAHIRWCIARRPTDKALSQVLVKLTKERMAQRMRAVNASHAIVPPHDRSKAGATPQPYDGLK